MKKKDIILDFTSLLDVTLIVIFFFVLFSHLDSQENKARTDAKVNELETAIQEAEEREEVANEQIAQLEEEIGIVQEASERQSSNISEILEFNRSDNIKIILDMQTDGWSIRLIKSDEVIAVLTDGNNLSDEILTALEKADYETSNTIFCDFVFDGSIPGTASAYRKITSGLDDVSTKYKYLYISETDLSTGEE